MLEEQVRAEFYGDHQSQKEKGMVVKELTERM